MFNGNSNSQLDLTETLVFLPSFTFIYLFFDKTFISHKPKKGQLLDRQRPAKCP